MNRYLNHLRRIKSKRWGCGDGLFLCLAVLTLSACSSKSSDEQTELLVAAAASLKEVMTDIGVGFETQYGVKILFNFAGSNLLQRQIETGAPVDIFASAAAVQMDALAEQHLITQDTRTTFATNMLVLIVPQDSPLKTFDDLADEQITRIAVGSEGVPIRLYSEETLRHIGLWETLSSKYIFSGNTRQVLEYVAQGETDAGLVYRTDALIRAKVRVVAEADFSWHRPIEYPMAVIADSPQQNVARQFITFVMSDTGQEIIRRHGFKN